VSAEVTPALTPLKWDSEFFGFRVGRINLDDFEKNHKFKVLENISKSDYQLIYIFCSPENELGNAFSMQLAGNPIDIKMDYAKPVSKIPFALADHIISIVAPPISSADINALYRLALKSAHVSRFILDDRIDRSKAQLLYKLWVDNSLSGEIADAVYCARQGDKIIGFVTICLEPNDSARIGLIAVDDVARGTGLGRALMATAIAWADQHGAKTLYVATQVANTGACAFYEKLGFTLDSRINIYHFWKP
jgi:dTDP-4-amino-4,6-dideoxy-D-galactose acyltransferase